MEYTNIIRILETDYKRNLVSLKQDGNVINYLTEDATITVNSTTVDNVTQVCLRSVDDKVFVYLNTTRFEYSKFDLADITTFTVT